MIPKAFPKTLSPKTKISQCPAVSHCVLLLTLLNPHFAFCTALTFSVLTARVFFGKISRREALLIPFKKILAKEESMHTLAQ